MSKQTNRRSFFKQGALVGVGFWVAERSVGWAESRSPNEKLNIAAIGCGGKGESDVQHCATENIVALCDVDEKRAERTFKRFPKARKYKDFRVMLEKEEKNIDAVIVSTPDHVHAVAGVMAMRMGKHLYCQKPLTQTVYEARLMRKVAKEKGVATQMGNQGTACTALREAVEVVQAGAIGQVHEVHVWSNRPIWPQGWKAILGHSGVKYALHGKPKPKNKPPATLDWDLWLGPAAYRPYDPIYVPFSWRGWWEFGTGALGDMACHTVNLPFFALKLGYPCSIEADVPYVNDETPAEWSRIVFQFPKREKFDPVTLTWYDGTRTGLPKRLRVFERVLNKHGIKNVPSSGSIMIGTEGILYSPGDYGGSYQLLPKEKYAGYKKPEPRLPRLPQDNLDKSHHQEWIAACKGGPPAMSNFDNGAYLTEIILLGNVAMRVGKKIEWDGPNMKSPNCPEAAKYIKREYRKGWEL